MNRPQSRSAKSTTRDACERLSQRLEERLARERRAGRADWLLIEEARLTRARRALFGSAPK